MLNSGVFISVEGVEGSGKSTMIQQIFRYLESREIDVVMTREPGGIEIAEQIRAVILDKGNTKMDGRTEALLYAAARRQHLVEKIIPALNEGKVVLCDRFIDSSLAYQGYARGLGIDEVLAINEFAIGSILPNLTLYLDLDPQVGLDRISANQKREVNRLDLEEIQFHIKVQKGYEEVIKRYPNRIVRLNADQELSQVISDVKKTLSDRLQL